MLLDMFLYLVLERHLIPVEIEGYDRIDRVGELGYQKEAEDRVEDLLVVGVDGPLHIR